MEPIVNLAGLEKQWFAAILNGSKQTERRTRKRRDATLEAIRAGELLILFEKRTDRNLTARVVGVKRFSQPDGKYRYCIRLRLLRAWTGVVPHLQGWHRVSADRLNLPGSLTQQ